MKIKWAKMLTGRNTACEEVTERLGREVRPDRRQGDGTFSEGPDANLKDAVVYVDDGGQRHCDLPPHFGGRRIVNGIYYAVHDRPIAFFEDGHYYVAVQWGGIKLAPGSDDIPGPLAGCVGEIVEISGVPVFKVIEDGQVICHVRSVRAWQKIRRRIEDRLRKELRFVERAADALSIDLT